MSATWDLTALLNAADAKASQPERHLWLARLLEWLRHAPAPKDGAAEPRTPKPVLRLRQLLNVLENNPAYRERVHGMLRAFWREADGAALYADFGFAPRVSLLSEVASRLGQTWLPRSPETADLSELFQVVFEPADGAWLQALDEPTLARVAALLASAQGGADWRRMMLDAITILVSAVHAEGYAPALRKRMSPALCADEPFRQLTRAADALRSALQEGDQPRAFQEAQYLRALLDQCRRAAASITEHLEEFGVSVDIVFGADQLRARTLRIEQLLECVLSPAPAGDLLRLIVELLRVQGERRGLRMLLANQYSLMARQVAERSAETGEHYITRDRAEYRAMLASAAGGGAVIAGTTFVKFGIGALGLAAFWNGFWAGANYALSFVIVMLLHWTVATKQPAMTAPAMAASLGALGRAGEGAERDAAVNDFVDRVAGLIRSQAAGIFGNLVVCGPLVLGVQWAASALFGRALVGAEQAEYVLHSLTLLGPSLLFAAFTGVLLFGSSLVAGWVENWFVFHRLDSAIAWNPRIVAALGAPRARRWGAWWRANVSGLAGNISLGMMLGLVPALFLFFGLPVEVRHVTLSTGQLGAAVGALGWPVFSQPAFWWCVAGIALTGVLNVGVSFWLAFKVALRSRGIRVADRRLIRAAIWQRLRRAPGSFILPPR